MKIFSLAIDSFTGKIRYLCIYKNSTLLYNKMKYDKINKNLFVENRKKFVQELKPNSIAIFNSNDIMPTNADGTMPFKQNSDLFWLTGVDQEESMLVLFPDCKEERYKEFLLLKETSPLIAVWEGKKLTKDDAFSVSGINSVFWNSKKEDLLSRLIKQSDGLFLNKNEHARSSCLVETRDDRFWRWCENNFPKKSIASSASIMHNLRSVKSEIEVDLIKKACDITESGFRKILPFVKPGVAEYEIEAEFIREFIRKKSSGFAYEPIIASGQNACVLHYTQNNSFCKKGDVLLLDVGAEYANYASDMTRSIPVSGRFLKRQKAVYNAVLGVMKQATSLLVPGTLLSDYHKAVGFLMEEALVNLGLLNIKEIKNQSKEKPAYKKYFMHGTSHFLGLDVHDVGLFDRPIKKGMVFTCEPGIYIPKK